MGLDKKAILEADDLPKVKVSVPEWGDHIWVRTLTGTERDQFESQIYHAKDGGTTLSLSNIRARLCVLTIVDHAGKRIFEDRDIAELGKKSSLVLDRIFTVAQKLNGLRGEDVEEMAKN